MRFEIKTLVEIRLVKNIFDVNTSAACQVNNETAYLQSELPLNLKNMGQIRSRGGGRKLCVLACHLTLVLFHFTKSFYICNLQTEFIIDRNTVCDKKIEVDLININVIRAYEVRTDRETA